MGVHSVRRADVSAPPPSEGHIVADALDARLGTNAQTWAASTVRDQTSRATLVKADKIARTIVDRLSVADVDLLRQARASTPPGAFHSSTSTS